MKANYDDIFNAIAAGKVVYLAYQDVVENSFNMQYFTNYVSRQRKQLASLGVSEDIGILKQEIVNKSGVSFLRISLVKKELKTFSILVVDPENDSIDRNEK